MWAPFWGAPGGAVPRRSFPYGLKAPSLGRRQRDPASGRPHGRPPQRRHATDPATGGPARPAGRGHDRPPARKTGRPRRKPDLVIADRGYDHDKYRRLLWARGIKPVIARRRTAHGSGLGRQRWVVERGFAHLHNFRRLRIRYERYPEIHTALLVLACSILCWRRLKSL